MEVLHQERRALELQTVDAAADAYLEDYRAKHRAPAFAECALKHVKRLIGFMVVMQVTPAVLKKYQSDRLNEQASGKTINDEVGVVLRLCGAQGDTIRAELKRTKALRLAQPRGFRLKVSVIAA